jgi:hypothetical protein
MKDLVCEAGPAELLARQILVVQFHGYHSLGWKPLGAVLPSQERGFQLVKRAMTRNALIVVVLGWARTPANARWSRAVKGLAEYPNTIWNKNRAATVNRGNLGDIAFDRIRDALLNDRDRGV